MAQGSAAVNLGLKLSTVRLTLPNTMASERPSQVGYLNNRTEALVQIHYMFFVSVFRSLPVVHNLHADRWLLVLFECEHGRRFLDSR